MNLGYKKQDYYLILGILSIVPMYIFKSFYIGFLGVFAVGIYVGIIINKREAKE